MKVAVAAGGLDVLVTWEASRAQRDLDAYLELRRLCAASGVRWAYSGTVYDLAHGSDRFRTGLDALVAEDEVEKMRSRVLRALRANANSGRPHGVVGFGFRREYDPSHANSSDSFTMRHKLHCFVRRRDGCWPVSRYARLPRTGKHGACRHRALAGRGSDGDRTGSDVY